MRGREGEICFVSYKIHNSVCNGKWQWEQRCKSVSLLLERLLAG